MVALRRFGPYGATAGEVATALRLGGVSASAPAVAMRLQKYARRGAVRVEYRTAREGNTERPARTEERFFAP